MITAFKTFRCHFPLGSHHTPVTSGRSARFEGVSRRDAYRLVAKEKPQNRPPPAIFAANKPNDFPAEFDARQVWPGCVHSVLVRKPKAGLSLEGLGTKFVCRTKATVALAGLLEAPKLYLIDFASNLMYFLLTIGPHSTNH